MAQDGILFSTPWIQEVKLPSPYNDIPNESLFLNELGQLFIGKENGLSIISGVHSTHLHMNGPVYVAGKGSDTLLYVAENDFGYLLTEDISEIKIQSRKHLIPSSQRTFVPSGLIHWEGSYFMNTHRGVYCFSGGKVQLHSFNDLPTQLHKLDNELFLVVEGKGLSRWNGSEFRQIVSQLQTGGDPAALLHLDQEMLEILTSSGRLYSLALTDSSLQYIVTFPSVEKISFIDHINDSLVLIDEQHTGISIYNHSGIRINMLGTRGGLPDFEICQLLSREEEIWLLSSHSLYKINYPSPLTILEFDSFGVGRILNSLVSREGLFLATSEGVFKIRQQKTNPEQWHLTTLMPKPGESFHLLTSVGKEIFTAGFHSLLNIRDESVTVIDSGIYTGIGAMQSHRLVASNQEGLIRYNYSDQKWTGSNVDPSLSFSHSFVEYDDRLYFICKNQVFRLSSNLERAISIPFQIDEQVFRLNQVNRKLYLVGSHQVNVFDQDEESFIPLESTHAIQLLTESEVIAPVNSGEYWVVQSDVNQNSNLLHLTGWEQQIDNQTLLPILQNLGEIINLAFRDSLLYITGKHSISLFDLRVLKENRMRSPVRLEVLSQDDHSMELYLTGLEFQSVPEPLFRYRLDPIQERWSEWNNSREVVVNNLKQGDYRFVAQAKDLYGRITESSELLITIKPLVYNTWYAYLFYGFLLLIGLFLFRKWRLLSYQRAESRISQRMQRKLDDMAEEKERSDKLVAEVLPERTAKQLKTTGKAKWDKYERATVLFSDIQGFTRIAEEMNPEALIDELDKFFFHFDSVVEKYNIEKIKTIGDAYMAAGGIPEKNSTNPVEVVLAALEMQSYMQHLKSSKAEIWDLRIGIHTGPVIAGVVGHKKVSYDIWGDTVNTASRMESSGMPGKVNISGITYGMVKEYFLCEYRGKLPVKYKGNIDMYFVNGLRPELSVDLKQIPNKRFFIKLQLLRLGDLEDKVFDNLLHELPDSLHFHTIEHARKVYNQSFLLCRAEEIEQEDRLLVRTAALMLFTGLTQSFINYENRSSVISREILPDFKYSEAQIDQICNLIMATKMPLDPHNQLEKILIDAKMEYIGRPDFTAQIKLLYQEIREAGAKINGQQFKKQQLELLYEFEYFTVAAQRLREIPGTEQMAKLEQERWI